MSDAQYRVVVIGPGDEVLDVIPLDGTDLGVRGEVDHIGQLVADGMGSDHRYACAALPSDYDDDL